MPENSDPDVGDLPIDPDTSGDRLTGTVHRLPSLFTSQWDVLLAISAGGALGKRLFKFDHAAAAVVGQLDHPAGDQKAFVIGAGGGDETGLGNAQHGFALLNV